MNLTLLKLLSKRAALIKSPREFFRGACPMGDHTPKNLLLFSRQTSQELQPRGQDRFQHRRHVLILNARTAGSVAIDGHWKRLEPGEAILVFPYQVHTYGHLESSQISWLFLTFDGDVPSKWEPLRHRVVPFSDLPEAGIWLDQITQAWGKRKFRENDIAHLASLLLEGLLRQAQGRNMNRTATASKTTSPWQGSDHLLPAIHEIVESRHPACRIKDLAGYLNFSESHLRAKFRKDIGQSLGHYLQQIRITRAAALLAGTQLRIGEIAEQCGFESVYSFSRSFKHATGMSPRSYRLSHQKR